jgi:protein-S-isoprenylcysteine O-methyltransferase Ste14
MGLIQRLNHHVIFSPARWPRREGISRAMALAVITGFLVLRGVQFDQFPQTWSAAVHFYGAFATPAGPVYSHGDIVLLWSIRLAVWLVETGIFLGYLASYVSRVKAVAVADGFMETAFPIIVAGIPVLMSLAPYTLPRWVPFSAPAHVYIYLVVMGLIVSGGLINLIGLLTMRRAFTIMTEARSLVTRGIFGWVRHPLYCGHFIMFFGSLLLRFQVYTVIMFSLFAVGQVIRARTEERKLEQAFPAYKAYQTQTGMFFPKLTR